MNLILTTLSVRKPSVRYTAAAFALLSVLAFSGCGETKQKTGGVKTDEFKVALLTSGPVDDHGWNQSAYDGLMKIQKDLGAKVDKQENVKPNQIEEAMRDFAGRGYNLIIGHGDEYGDTAGKLAPQYPKTAFVTTGGDKSAANLTPIHFATEEGCYLQGMEAGAVSKSGKGGFVGGMEIPPVKAAADAFAQGAKAINPKFDFKVTYINSWTDPAAAKTQTLALLNNGCDVIAHNCDAASKGMFDTAGSKSGVYTFGVNGNENDRVANVLSSAVLDIPKAFTDMAAQVKNHTFKGGPVTLGLKDGDVELVDNPKLSSVISADAKKKIDQAKQDIVSGKLQLKGR